MLIIIIEKKWCKIGFFTQPHTDTRTEKYLHYPEKRREARREERKESQDGRRGGETKRARAALPDRIEFTSFSPLLPWIWLSSWFIFGGLLLWFFFSLFFFFCFFLQLFISCCSSFFVTIKYSLTQWRPIIREGTLLWFLSNLHISFHFFFLLILLLLSFFLSSHFHIFFVDVLPFFFLFWVSTLTP